MPATRSSATKSSTPSQNVSGRTTTRTKADDPLSKAKRPRRKASGTTVPQNTDVPQWDTSVPTEGLPAKNTRSRRKVTKESSIPDIPLPNPTDRTDGRKKQLLLVHNSYEQVPSAPFGGIVPQTGLETKRPTRGRPKKVVVPFQAGEEWVSKGKTRGRAPSSPSSVSTTLSTPSIVDVPPPLHNASYPSSSSHGVYQTTYHLRSNDRSGSLSAELSPHQHLQRLGSQSLFIMPHTPTNLEKRPIQGMPIKVASAASSSTEEISRTSLANIPTIPTYPTIPDVPPTPYCASSAVSLSRSVSRTMYDLEPNDYTRSLSSEVSSDQPQMVESEHYDMQYIPAELEEHPNRGNPRKVTVVTAVDEGSSASSTDIPTPAVQLLFSDMSFAASSLEDLEPNDYTRSLSDTPSFNQPLQPEAAPQPSYAMPYPLYQLPNHGYPTPRYHASSTYSSSNPYSSYIDEETAASSSAHVDWPDYTDLPSPQDPYYYGLDRSDYIPPCSEA